MSSHNLNDKDEQALVMAMLERFKNQRLPRLLEIKRFVDEGNPLLESDISFLEEALSDAQHNKGIQDRHPEFHDLIKKIISLYNEITEQALANEKQ